MINDALGTVFYSVCMVGLGMFIQWAGIMPWLASKTPWKK